MEEENTAVHYRTFRRASKRVPAKRSNVEDQPERSLSAVRVEQEKLESRFLD
jgi:hypothetical protein